jgi:hypothetical protein
MQVLQFWSDAHRETSVDVFVTEPFDFDAEYASALLSPLNDGITVRSVSLPTLIRMKEEANRPQDVMDEAGLWEKLLRRSLVIRLGVGREVRIDEDPLAIAVTAARMDRQALEVQEISTWFSVILTRSFLCRWICGAL